MRQVADEEENAHGHDHVCHVPLGLVVEALVARNGTERSLSSELGLARLLGRTPGYLVLVGEFNVVVVVAACLCRAAVASALFDELDLLLEVQV